MKKNAYEEMFRVEEAHWWYVILHDLVVLLSETKLSRQPLKILDAGCGTGGLMAELSRAGHEIEGFDCSEEALRFCRQRGLKNVFKADINDWDPNPGTYDLVVSMDVLYHEWVRDQVKALRALSCGLKENGLIMLNYPAFPLLSRHHDKVVMVRERYTKKTLKTYLAEAGLEPVILSYRLPHAFLSLLLLRLYESAKKDGGEQRSDIAEVPSEFINRLLIQAGKLENRLIARGISMPFGSSLFVVAKRAG